MHTNVLHTCANGANMGQPMLALKAVHEAQVAAKVIEGELQGNKELAEYLKSSAFNARAISSVGFTDPEVPWVGLTEDRSQCASHQGEKGLVALVRLGPCHFQRPRRSRDQLAV